MTLSLSRLTLTALTLTLTQQVLAVLPTVTADPTNVGDAVNGGAVSLPTQFSVAPAQPIVTRPLSNPIAAQAPLAVNQTHTSYLPVSSNTASEATAQLTPKVLASLVTRDAQGQEILAPVDAQTRLMSGNLVEYHAYITNTSPDRVRSVKVTLAIPANTELTSLADMTPARPYGSTDGVNFQYMPLKANIGGVLQELPMSYYKAVRWHIEGLGLNEVAEVKFRVRVK